MNKVPLTFIGNLTKQPELRFFKSGAAVLRFTLAHAPRYYSKAEQDYVDGAPIFMPVELISRGTEKQNDHIAALAESFRTGDRLIAVGELVQRTKKDGDERKSWNVLEADEIGPSTKFTTVAINRAEQ